MNQCLSNHGDAGFEFGLDYGVNPELVQLQNIVCPQGTSDDRDHRIEAPGTVYGQTDGALAGAVSNKSALFPSVRLSKFHLP